jgi:hypothetical protein
MKGEEAREEIMGAEEENEKKKKKTEKRKTGGRAIDQASHSGALGFDRSTGSVGFVVDKVALRQFSPSTSVSPANSHSTASPILVYHPEWYNRLFSGQSTDWLVSPHPNPPKENEIKAKK